MLSGSGYFASAKEESKDPYPLCNEIDETSKGILTMQSLPLSKRPVGPMYAPTGMGSFDSVAVRFASRYYARDDIHSLVEVQSHDGRSGVLAFHN